ncbi:MAG: citrate lyase acyl carrier protein [Eubacteriales bacterium]
MEITKAAQAGALEARDVLVTVEPNNNRGVQIELKTKSVIKKQFGKQIDRVIREKVAELGVENINIKVEDKGALDYTIIARVYAAIERAV